MTEKGGDAKLVRTVAFSSEGDQYEILVLAKDSGYILHVKKNGVLLHLGGSVDYDTAFDYEQRFGKAACEMLIELLQNSIKNKAEEPK